MLWSIAGAALVFACSSTSDDSPSPSAGASGSGASASVAGAGGQGNAGTAGTAGSGVATGGKGGSAAQTGGSSGSAGSSAGTANQPQCKLPDGLPLTAPTAIAVPASEDFTFDREGNLIGIGLAGGLSHSTYEGKTEVVLPKFIEQGPVRGVRYLKNGDLLVVDGGSGALVRVTPSGGVTTVVSGLDQPNGIVIGSSGHAFVSVHDGAIEYNPDDDSSDFAVKGGGGYYDGITLGLDDKTLYLVDPIAGTIKESDLSVAMASRMLSDIVNIKDFASTENVFLDGMTLDECGNRYVVQMNGSVWQVPREGDPKQIISLDAGILCAVNFGSGVGGWKADALYVMTLSSTGVYEVPLGFRGKKDPYLQ